jgi:hypothetical protein
MRTLVLDSELYHALADLARFLEANATKEDYGFLDGGQTLEIRSTLLEKCRQNLEWQQLEQRYEQVNGSLYTPDGDWDAS